MSARSSGGVSPDCFREVSRRDKEGVLQQKEALEIPS